jgi:hypothetical protein
MTTETTVGTQGPDAFGYHIFTCPSCGQAKYGIKDAHIALCSRIATPVSMDAIAFAQAQKSLIDKAVADAIASMEAKFKLSSNPTGDAKIDAAIQILVDDGLSRSLAAAIVSEKGADYVIPTAA